MDDRVTMLLPRNTALPRPGTSFLTLFALLSFALTPARDSVGQCEVIIDQDFQEVPAGGSLPGWHLDGAAARIAAVDVGGGANHVLSLTQGQNFQHGWAWFERTLDLEHDRVELDFDLFIGEGTATVGADGFSVIFQFDEDMDARGETGGGLGVENFRGGGSPYIGISFDIFDNDDIGIGLFGVDLEVALDPETPCDELGEFRTCHVELNQNARGVPITGPAPDFLRSAKLYEETGNREYLVHVTVIYDNRLLLVELEGGVTCAVNEEGAVVERLFGRQVVIAHVLDPLPDRPSNIGFAATTGGANAVQWIDDVVLSTCESRVQYVQEPVLSSGALNCEGPEVDARAEIGMRFRHDGIFGNPAAPVTDLEFDLPVTLSRFGRVFGRKHFRRGGPIRDLDVQAIDVTGIPGAGDETRELFATEALASTEVRYGAHVEPGRYEVTLYWAESSAEAVNDQGQGVRIFDVYLNDNRVLCNWSAAAAAGPEGGGDPTAFSAAILKALERTFSLDIPDTGAGFGALDVVVEDLGGGTPPGDAGLNALSFRRTGGLTGDPTGGDLECIRKAPGDDPPGILFEADFDDLGDGACPPGIASNTAYRGSFSPKVTGGRLRLLDQLGGRQVTSAIFEKTVDVSQFSLRAEFHVYMEPLVGAENVSCGSFFVMRGNDVSTLGPGSALSGHGGGIPTNAYGFAVEFDPSVGEDIYVQNDPSGFNDPGAPFPHVGINNLSRHSRITNVEFDPNLKPEAFGGTGWPDFLHTDGVRVEVTYNGGLVQVKLEGTTAEGNAFGPTLVAEAEVPPVWTPQAIVGFSGGSWSGGPPRLWRSHDLGSRGDSTPSTLPSWRPQRRRGHEPHRRRVPAGAPVPWGSRAHLP